MNMLGDERTSESLDQLQARIHPDGTWRAGRHYWRPSGGKLYQEPVDWGRRGPNAMITLNALRVLKAAGRIKITNAGDEYGFITHPN
jgi:hypothetical protein